jgi:hypothetical protein
MGYERGNPHTETQQRSTREKWNRCRTPTKHSYISKLTFSSSPSCANSIIAPSLQTMPRAPPHPLVNGDQRKDSGIIADQNCVHVFILDVPALDAHEARGGLGGHGRCGPRTQRSWQLVSDKQASLVRRLKRGRRSSDA